MSSQKSIAIIGGGASALYLACELHPLFNVRLYERGKSLGKKYLVAGKGGFNISHHHPVISDLQAQYSPRWFFDPIVADFGSDSLQKWYGDKGIPTFVGSSNRIFPTAEFSPGDVLRTLKAHFSGHVPIYYSHEFVGFTPDGKPRIENKESIQTIEADYFIFCLGGASWKVTGSDGSWRSYFDKIGVATHPFSAANCGLEVSWPVTISSHHIGKPLKNITCSFDGKEQKGEAIITSYGLEGNAIYPLATRVGKAIHTNSPLKLVLNLKPQLSAKQIHQKLQHKQPKNYAETLGLSSQHWALLKAFTSKAEFTDLSLLVHRIQSLPIPIHALRPINESISTTGGIAPSALTPHLSLTKYPNVFVSGEMVDWDAPTGGYLLHGCFAMAHKIVNHLKNNLTKV